jgi:hypothetical protein
MSSETINRTGCGEAIRLATAVESEPAPADPWPPRDLPELEFFDDKGDKPIAAFGNSGGDLQMLQWEAGLPIRMC